MTALYAKFSTGLRYFLIRTTGRQDVEDRLHDVFLVVIKAIQGGSLREPDRLAGFIRTVAQRSCAEYIDALMKSRSREQDSEESCELRDKQLSIEAKLFVEERASLMRDALAQLSARDRDILERFYLLEQSAEQICEDMALTETQFRLCKSRAKARLGEIGRKRLNPTTRPATRSLLRAA